MAGDNREMREKAENKIPRVGKKEEILAAAVKLFAEYGYDGVSIGRIASEVGVAKSTILHHFRSKKALHISINRAPFEELSRTTATSMEGIEGRLEKILGFFESLCVWLREKPHYARLILRMQMDDPHRSRRGATRYWEPIMRPVLRELEEGQTRGEFAPGDARMLLFNFGNLILYYFSTRELQRDFVAGSRDMTVEDASEIFHHQIREIIARTLRSS